MAKAVDGQEDDMGVVEKVTWLGFASAAVGALVGASDGVGLLEGFVVVTGGAVAWWVRRSDRRSQGRRPRGG